MPPACLRTFIFPADSLGSDDLVGCNTRITLSQLVVDKIPILTFLAVQFGPLFCKTQK